MNVSSWLLWGVIATLLLTTTLSAAQGLGLTRVSFPFLVGTMFTPDRSRAKVIGFAVHLINGWAFSLLYVAAFQAWGRATWWEGAAIGALHALTALTVGMALLPSVHRRMATESYGPTVVPELEPPGFLGLHYGRQTPVVSLVAHLLFGAVLGAFYQLAP